MSRGRLAVPISVLAVSVLAGCGGKKEPGVLASTTVPALTGAKAKPPEPVTAGAVARIPALTESSRRLGFADLGRLDAVAAILPPGTVLSTVLGPGAGRVEALPAGAARTAIQVAGATVLRGAKLPAGLGAPAGADGAVLGGPPALVRALQQTRPEVNVVAGRGATVVSSCLGESVATTTRQLPGEPLERVGVGLRPSAAVPGKVDLVVCYAPLQTRQIARAVQRIERRYGTLRSGANATAASEEEYGEVTLMVASIPADRVPRAQVERLLGGGRSLLALVDRR